MRTAQEKFSAAFGILIFVASLSYGILFNSSRTTEFLTWDETDYAKAAGEGVVVNALEQQTLSLAEFFELGLAKIKKQQPDISGFPSEFIDPFHLRHYHLPLPVYYWSLFLNDDIETQDYLLRLSNILLQVLCAGVILFFMIKIFSSGFNSVSFPFACVAVSFFITSDIFLDAFFAINFHSFFLIAALLFVFCLIKYMFVPLQSNAILFGMSSAVVLCTLETSPFIFCGAVLAVLLLKQQKNFKTHWKTAAAAFIIASILLMPGVIFTLGPVKSWAMYVYRVFAMNNESYDDISVAATLLTLLKNNWLLSLVIFAGYGIHFFVRRSAPDVSKVLRFPAVIGLVYGILILPFTINTTYLFPAAGLIFLGSMPGLFKLAQSSSTFIYFFSVLAVVSICVLFYRTDFRETKDIAVKRQVNFRSDMNEMKKILSRGQPVLADGGRIFTYYLPGDAELIYELFRIHNRNAQFAIRKNYSYVVQENELKNNFYSGILIGKGRNYTAEQFEQLKRWGYKFKELNNYFLFYL